MNSENSESTQTDQSQCYLSAALRRALRKALRKGANPEKAPGMQAYMKSKMPYLGVQTPALKAICREVFTAHPLEAQKCWLDAILAIWRNADYREERYAAIKPFEIVVYLIQYATVILRDHRVFCLSERF